MRVFLAFLLIGFAPCAQAQWIELPWPVLDATLPVSKPDDFDASKSYPAIVFYHGTGGKPTAELIHRMTAGKDFVLVGMTYRHQGRFDYSEQEIADELGLLNALKKTLTGSLAVDAKRIYVGGFSKGGWHTALLLDRDRSLAGGLILGSGVFENRKDAPKFGGPPSIYIGCGRYDGNYPPSLGALIYFRNLGAQVTHESWLDTGHEYPKQPPEAMRQWLRIQAAAADLKNEATTWIAARLSVIEAISDPVGQSFAFDEFVTLPFTKKFGTQAVAAARTELALLAANPKVVAEQKWREESRLILARECRDRLLTTLQEASRSHQQLAAQAVGTRAGTEATRDFERTRELLKTAKVVTRVDQPEAIAPETPAPPTSNPDRRAFFPPGSKVKPAR